MSEHFSLRDRVEVLAAALHAAGIRSGDKDGLPRLVAEGVLANLVRVQRVGLYRIPALSASGAGVDTVVEVPLHAFAEVDQETRRWFDQGSIYSRLEKHPSSEWFNGNAEALKFCAMKVRLLLDLPALSDTPVAGVPPPPCSETT
jgi:hypothetical protein